MSNLTPDELARLRLKAKHGMLTAEERAALEAYEAAAQPAPQTPVPAYMVSGGTTDAEETNLD